MAIFRSILGVIVGVAFAMALIVAIEVLGHAVYPPPEAIRTAMEKQDYAAMRQAVTDWMPTAPVGALLFPLAGWIAGTFFGGLAAAWIAGRKTLLIAGLVAALPLLGTIVNLAMIPHPVWMWPAALIGILLAALAAAKLGPRGASAGPKPYDMREKNMAC